MIVTNIKLTIFGVALVFDVGAALVRAKDLDRAGNARALVQHRCRQIDGYRHQSRDSLDLRGIGSALAAAGGILFGLDQITINPLMGVLTGLKAFVAAVLGGIGSIPGAVVGGLLIGLAEQLTAGYLSPEYRDAITFVISDPDLAAQAGRACSVSCAWRRYEAHANSPCQ